SDEANLPRMRADIPAQWNFRHPRPLHEPGLDNCFSGWDGKARIRWPQQDIELLISASEELDHLVVFTPSADKGFFALEPVSHANNALGMPGPLANGMRVLGPGETMTASCSLHLT